MVGRVSTKQAPPPPSLPRSRSHTGEVRGRRATGSPGCRGVTTGALPALHSPTIASTTATALYRWSVPTGRPTHERRSAVDDTTPRAAAPALFAQCRGGGRRVDARARRARRRVRARRGSASALRTPPLAEVNVTKLVSTAAPHAVWRPLSRAGARGRRARRGRARAVRRRTARRAAIARGGGRRRAVGAARRRAARALACAYACGRACGGRAAGGGGEGAGAAASAESGASGWRCWRSGGGTLALGRMRRSAPTKRWWRRAVRA